MKWKDKQARTKNKLAEKFGNLLVGNDRGEKKDQKDEVKTDELYTITIMML